MENKFHILDIKEVERQLNTDIESGLSIREARARLEEEKKNDGGDRRSLFVPQKDSYKKALLTFLLSPSLIILVLLSLLAAIFGRSVTGILVFVIALAGCIGGGMVLQKSQRKLERLCESASPVVKVRRGGRIFYIDSRSVVKGDIILFSCGDILPCDARLTVSNELYVKELIITKDGIRNRDAVKNCFTEHSDKIVSPNAENMVYAGSAVISGEGEAVVTATGAEVYLAAYCKDGQLAGDIELNSANNAFEATIQKAVFFSLAAIALVSLVSIITYEKNSLISSFLLLISAFSMISVEVYRACKKNIFSSCMEKLNRFSRSQKDLVAIVRNGKTFDGLTRITDVVLLGNAAFTDGIAHVRDFYFSGKKIEDLPQNTDYGRRIYTCIYTYLRSLYESGSRSELLLDGVADSLSYHLRKTQFDKKGADLIINSLYFAKDPSGETGYACAEISGNELRILLTFDDSLLSICRFFRSIDGFPKILSEEEKKKIRDFDSDTSHRGGRTLCVFTEINGETLFEGALSLYENVDPYFEKAVSDLSNFGIRVTSFFRDTEEFNRLKSLCPSFFNYKIAYAPAFDASCKNITESYSEYNVYVGFDTDQYSSILDAMHKNGAVVATFGIDNSYYDLMSKADISVSCDSIRYDLSAKYSDTVFESLPQDGRDTNTRCSQMTKLLSKVLVHRTNVNGGGLSSLENAVRRSRGAHVSASVSLLFFIMLMCSLIPIMIFSLLLGVELINAVQGCCLSMTAALLAMILFANSEPRTSYIYSVTDYTDHDIGLLKCKCYALLARCAVSIIVIFAVKLLDVFSVFGDKASYGMPIFISLIFITGADLLLINKEFFKRGEGRRLLWTRYLIAYAVLLVICGIITQGVFARELFPSGIGAFEFILTPVYCIIYFATVIVAEMIEKKRKVK